MGVPHEFAPPVPRCPSCWSWRVQAEVLPHGGLNIRWVHQRRCRTRWDRVARRHAELHVFECLAREGVFVADYGADPPRHHYFQGVT